MGGTFRPGRTMPGTPLPLIPAAEVGARDRVDLAGLWGSEVSEELAAYAQCHLAEVESVRHLADGRTVLYLFDAPAHAVIPAGMLLPVERSAR
ncbi:MAG: hypothetical protein CMH36_08935 [Microbacterium sp.]|nr:hypothetical protein [Microbacterium sp.]